MAAAIVRASDLGLVILGTESAHAHYVGNWSLKPNQLGRNVLASIGNAAAFEALKLASGLSVLGYGSTFSFYTPLLIKATLFALEKVGVDPKNRCYVAVDFAHRKWDRFAQVVNLVACVALLSLGVPLFGFVGAALVVQVVVLAGSLGCDMKRAQMLEATDYVRKNVLLDSDMREKPPESLKPYYHLVTLARENNLEERDVRDLIAWMDGYEKYLPISTDSLERKLAHLTVLQELEVSTDLTAFYQGLTDFAFNLAYMQPGLDQDKMLSSYIGRTRAISRQLDNLDELVKAKLKAMQATTTL
jgi:hypothetical protein